MAIAKWVVSVDWNNDGDHYDTNEDVTGDVLGLTLEHFRDLASGRVEAARLELELKNADHKYSPPNALSPLSGHLKPGRKVWLRAAYPYDALAGAPGSRLSAHQPDFDSSFSWGESAPGFQIAPSGMGARTAGAGAGRRVATMDFGERDVSFGCRFTRGADSSDHGGLCVRYSAAGSYLYARVTGAAVELRKVESGADSLVASAAHAWPAGESRLLQVVLHGDSVRVFVDDAEVLEASSSFNARATRHGLYCGGAADHAWSDFGGWVSLFHGAVDLVRPRPGAEYCYLRALDEMERLTTVTLYTHATASLPQTSDEILDDILDYAYVSLPGGGWTRAPSWWRTRGAPRSGTWARWTKSTGCRTRRTASYTSTATASGGWRPGATARRVPHGRAGDAGRLPRGRRRVLLRPRVGRRRGQHRERRLHAHPERDERGGAYGMEPDRAALVRRERDEGVPGREQDLRDDGRAGPSAARDRLRRQHPPPDGTGGADISREIRVSHPARAEFNGRGTLVRVTFGATRAT